MRAKEFIIEYKKYPTMDYEGITLTMVEKDGQLIVKALNDGGIAMGHVIFNIDGKELDPQDLQVDDKYQGQGIARVMYDYIKSRGFIINRSWDQTDAGAGFWNKHRGEDVRVWEQDMAEGSNAGDIELSHSMSPDMLYVHATSDGTDVGGARFKKIDGAWTGDIVHVYPQFRRQGIATKIYDYAEDLVGKIIPSKTLKPKGKKFWDNRDNQGVAEGSLNEFAPDGFNGDDDEGFSPEIAKMAQEDGFTKGASLADGATLERAMTINHWHSQHGGMYKQYFAKGFKQGRMNKINHDNKQYNLNLKLMKDGSIRHGEQGVAEAFNQPYALQWENGEFGDYDAYTKLPDGSNLSIMFNKEDDDVYAIEFWRNNSQDATGDGDSQKVFATVLSAIQEFLTTKEQPRFISFTGAKGEDDEGKDSRVSLYSKLLQRYATSWGYKLKNVFDRNDAVVFDLVRIKQDVAENISRRGMLKGLAGAAALGATGAQAGQFVDYDKLINDPELETVWVPRMQKLQQRCNVMLSKMMRITGSAWSEQLQGTTIRVESNDQHIQANAENRSISIDLTVFWDAPEDVLAFAIGHELGHIALGHTDVPITPEQSRKDESNADNFAVRLCKALGYNKAGVFKFLYAKKGEIENINKITSQPNSTHPTMTQRMDKARQQGFQLSKGGIQQMNTLMTHLA